MLEFTQAIRRYWWLIVVGLVVALAAGYAAGYRVEDGSFEPRGTAAYSTQTTVLLTSPRVQPFQAVIPGQLLAENETSATANDLPRAALVFAYMVNGSELRAQVEAQVGEIDGPAESLTAVQRTTQPRDAEPAGDVAGQIRFSPPILAIESTATTPERSVEIANAAFAVLEQTVIGQQDAVALPPEQRISFDTLGTETLEVNSGDTLVPSLVTGAAVFAAFLALILALNNARVARTRSAANRSAAGQTTSGEPVSGRRANRTVDRDEDLSI
ncbi:hypothetical protein [Planctomonas psychrotolerans]|uniref:hypothetical protein n=1 Tax=Planctomonas psychrotolerans TaxID=2528712 RepID=UPI00123C54D9|nr:hypothetical protein [Planctomonas psychrotolerans]